jgi:hypothetical protein
MKHRVTIHLILSDEMLSFLENYHDDLYTLWEVHEGA